MPDENISNTDSEKQKLQSRGYNLSILLGKGGYAKVYLCNFRSAKNQKETKLACKIIDTSKIPILFTRKFLPQELQILSQLNHPHIIQIHSILQRKNKFFIYMRHAEKGDLLNYINEKHGPIKEKLAKYWIRQLSLAIQYLHILEIAHRDIKCENILITINYNIKLTDFGFSRFCTYKQNNNIVYSDTYCGSISYASPQIIYGEPYNPKATDMWSIGCVLFLMLNKKPPFKNDNLKVMFFNQIKKNIQFRQYFSYTTNSYRTICTRKAVDLIYCLLEPNEKIRYTIEELLHSDWITMESKINILSDLEYKAIVNAIELTKRISTKNRGETIVQSKKSKSIHFYKEYNECFDLNLISSKLEFPQLMSQ